MSDEREVMGAEWEVEVYDKDGKLTDSKKGKNSLLVALPFLLWFGVDMNSALGQTCVNTAGGAQSPYWFDYNANAQAGIRLDCAAGSSAYGPVVGLNNTAVTADDSKLNTQALVGTGLNQFVHSAVTVNAVVLASPRANIRIDRTFTNGSGNPITVKEVGLYVKVYNGSFYFDICRDVIPDTAVANGSTLLLKYTLYISI